MKKPFIGARATPFPKNSSVSNVFKHEERQNTKKDIFDLHPLREGVKRIINYPPPSQKMIKNFPTFKCGTYPHIYLLLHIVRDNFYVFTFLHVSEHSEHICYFRFSLVGKN